MFEYVDTDTAFYLISGVAFLFYKIWQQTKISDVISAPMIFIIAGAFLSFTSLPLTASEILATENLDSKILEHITEFLVIISLGGAGLAIDRKMSIKSWHHTWVLLGAVMPLTILSIFIAGHYYMALPVASAFLLAAVLSPTDPVLARSVQVKGPSTGEENDVNVSLTSEAGLNDGLAFPFVYFAIALVAYSAGETSFQNMMTNWFAYEFCYKIIAGIGIGILCGLCYARLVYYMKYDFGKYQHDAGLLLLSLIFISYGFAELCSGYGFIAVFFTALFGRKFINKDKAPEDHAHLPHLFSDQFEKITVSLLLLWVGYYGYENYLSGIEVKEIILAFALVFVFRPLFGYLCLFPTRGTFIDHFAISFLGIRGIGSLYYLAYAQNHADFEYMPILWRIVFLTVIISIFVHGLSAQYIMNLIHKNTAKTA